MLSSVVFLRVICSKHPQQKFGTARHETHSVTFCYNLFKFPSILDLVLSLNTNDANPLLMSEWMHSITFLVVSVELAFLSSLHLQSFTHVLFKGH